ncbi:hypothetical protein GCM10010104_27080 [Streptomyces indiaensis]|uniref:Uncharacterized protein n=1 Tax=Streptomyces indiaensis TaxID=284033 RepID=A0ABN3DHW4_9ACTN
MTLTYEVMRLARTGGQRMVVYQAASCNPGRGGHAPTGVPGEPPAAGGTADRRSGPVGNGRGDGAQREDDMFRDSRTPNHCSAP